ncbi:MAG: R3H domain-containing nucleic acid-binding protein [Ilumatobacteraceae bacterium]
MEWVETTARTIEEAQELALDQLGIGADEAEFEVLATPKPGLFGRLRGEARVRARVRPTAVRPKQDRRRGKRGAPAETASAGAPATITEPSADGPSGDATERKPAGRRRSGGNGDRSAAPVPATTDHPDSNERSTMSTDDRSSDSSTNGAATDDEPVDVDAVRVAALEFMSGLTTAFGYDATVDATVDGTEIEVRVQGSSLGLMIGPGGRTLLGIQDLARVAAQRRLGDHETRLRVDVAGYRQKRRAALEKFADSVAEQVRATGVARSLDPMPSADRKVLHDALGAIDGVTSRSEGEDPYRRVVVTPA